MPKGKIQRKADGNHILYHYLQKELLTSDVWLFQMLTARLVTDLGVWIHPDTYSEMPVLLPFVVRDSRCRKSVGGQEAWGAPDKDGYFRDDNSMIKGLAKQLVASKKSSPIYAGRALGNGFTACHVWRAIKGDGKFASRNPRLNSFIPNLVWLPAQVAKLTDREGSFVQTYLQALSWKIYRDKKVKKKIKRHSEEAWKLLHCPVEIPEDGLPDKDELNYFDHSESFVRKKAEKLQSVLSLLEVAIKGAKCKKKMVSGRYDSGISGVGQKKLVKLHKGLSSYLEATQLLSDKA